MKAEPPFLLPTQEDKRKLCSQGAHITAHQRNWETKSTLGKDSSGHLMCHDLSDLKSLILIRTAPLVTEKKERASLKISDLPEYHEDFLNDTKGTKRKLTGMSVRGNREGFVPGLFQRKQKGKWDQENFLAVQFPAY